MINILTGVKLSLIPVNPLINSKNNGLASIIMYKEKASKMFKIVNEKKNEEYIELKSVTNKIKTKTEQAPTLKDSDPVLSQGSLYKSLP